MKIVCSIILLFIVICFNSYSQTYDTLDVHMINFEDPIQFISIDTSVQNIWQIGHPQKYLFDSAYSIPYAIITDTVNSYPDNNYSYFDLYIGNFNSYFYPTSIFIDFEHKFNTDTLNDGGYITISYDKGITWQNIVYDTTMNYYISPSNFYGDFLSQNIYTTDNTLFNGEYGFSGNSGGWLKTSLVWGTLLVKEPSVDTIIVRFNFISDSINNNKEGWVIDNIEIYGVNYWTGLNNTRPNNDKLLIYPNPVQNQLTVIESEAKQSQISIYNLQGQQVKSIKTKGQSKKYIVNVKDLPAGLYLVKVLTDKGSMVKKFVKQN